jgi:putative endonuclease
MDFHNFGTADKFTLRHRPWEIYLLINCSDRTQARKVENHLKRMKSKTYLRNLKKFPEMQSKLLQKYSQASDC